MRVKGFSVIVVLAGSLIGCATSQTTKAPAEPVVEYFKLDGGWPLAALAGIAVGSVWNYVATSALTWKKRSA